MKHTITCIIKAPHEAPKLQQIRNDLKTMQEIVDGYIETVTLPGGGILVCNEEGILLGLERNCQVEHHTIHGTFFICGLDPEDPENFGNVPMGWVNSFLRKG